MLGGNLQSMTSEQTGEIEECLCSCYRSVKSGVGRGKTGIQINHLAPPGPYITIGKTVGIGEIEAGRKQGLSVII